MEFNELSLELKLNILQYIPGEIALLLQFTTVCKQWRDMCRAPCLRKHLQCSSSSNPSLLIRHPLELLRKYYRLRSASFRSLRDWRWLIHLPVRHFLRRISFRECDIGAENIIAELTERFPSVQEVSAYDSIGDKFLVDISKWKLLKSIELAQFLAVDQTVKLDIGCKELAKNCVNLQVVVITGCYISDSAFCTLIDLRGTNLIELFLLNCDDVSDPSYLLLSQCSNLKKLRLYSVVHMTNLGLCAILDLHQLEELGIERSTGLSDNDFANAFNNAKFVKPKLTAISLSNCSLLGDSGFTAMVKRLPDLKCINISGCTNVSNVGFQALYDYSRNLKGLFMLGLVTDATLLTQFQRRMGDLFIFPKPELSS